MEGMPLTITSKITYNTSTLLILNVHYFLTCRIYSSVIEIDYQRQALKFSYIQKIVKSKIKRILILQKRQKMNKQLNDTIYLGVIINKIANKTEI